MHLNISICSAVAFWLGCCAGAIATPTDTTYILNREPPEPAVGNNALLAQSSSPIPPQTPELPKLPETVPAPEPPPILEIPTPQPQEEAPPPEELRIWVNRIVVRGSTIFSKKQLDQVTVPFLNRELSYEELLQIRSAITDLYVKKGYVTSGAYLPPQDVSSGEIVIQVLEGQVEEIEVQGLKFLRDRYVRDRIKRSIRTPLNIKRLEAGLQLLQSDPLIKTIQAELKPGSRLNKSVLTLNLKEANFLNSSYSVENRDSPSTGEWRHTLSFVNQNLTTNGDRLSIDLAFTAGAQNYSFDYQFPINTLDGTIFARYEQGHQRIIEAPFQDLGITSESESISFGFRQPIIRKPNREVALSLSADFRRSKTFIFEDIPFSFAQGVEDGVSKVRALRFTQEWTERRQKAVFALRSQVSVGLGAFGATVNGSGSDGRFISWLGQAQWVRAWTRRLTTVARLTTQITGDSLLPIEQFSVGGVDTVRGYRQNQRSGDSAVAGSLELRGLVFSDRELGRLELATFVDAGRAWNNNGTPQDSPKILFSAGLGVRWQLSPYISTQIDWAIPINTVKPQSGGLQEQGVFFSVRFQPW